MTLDKMVEVYAYVPIRVWREVYQGVLRHAYYDPKTGEKVETPGSRALYPWEEYLIPPFVVGLPKEAHLPVISAFLEPDPDSWRTRGWNYKVHRLTDARNRRMVIVGATVDPVDAYVLDARYRPEICSEAQPEVLYRQLWETRVQLSTYLKEPKIQSKYRLPEVMVQKTVHFDRLRVLKIESVKARER